jgi:hypothetical protein
MEFRRHENGDYYCQASARGIDYRLAFGVNNRCWNRAHLSGNGRICSLRSRGFPYSTSGFVLQAWRLWRLRKSFVGTDHSEATFVMRNTPATAQLQTSCIPLPVVVGVIA